MQSNNINSLNKVVLKYLGKNLEYFFTQDTLVSFSKSYDNLLLSSHENYEGVGLTLINEIKKIVDLIINVAEKEIEGAKFLDLLIVLGELLINLGNYSLAEDLLVRVVKMSSKLEDIDFKANAYFNLGELFYRQANWEKSLNYLIKSKELFKKERFQDGVIKSLNTMGAIAGERGMFLKAENYFAECINLLSNNSLNNLFANVIDNSGIIQLAKSNYNLALFEFNRAKTIFTQVNNFVHLANVLYNIGLIYMFKKDFTSAINEFDNSLDISFKAENVRILNLNLSAKANAYASLNDFDQSLAFLNKSMDLSTAINDRLTIADLYKIKGILSKKLKKKKKAEKDFLTSLRLNEELENKFNYFETMFELGLLYKDWGKNDLAKEKLIKAFNYKTKIGAENAAENINRELKEL